MLIYLNVIQHCICVYMCIQRLALEKGDPQQFLSAKKPSNKDKNRYVNVLPCKLTHVA